MCSWELPKYKSGEYIFSISFVRTPINTTNNEAGIAVKNAIFRMIHGQENKIRSPENAMINAPGFKVLKADKISENVFCPSEL